METVEDHYKYSVRRRDVLIWAVAILFLNQLLDALSDMSSASVGKLISHLCAVGVFQYLAWYAIVRLLLWSDRVQVARLRDVLIITALCLPVLFPTGRMIWVAATGVAVYLLIGSPGDLNMRAAGIVLAALSVQELWGHFIFELNAAALLNAESAVVGMSLQLVRAGTTWHENIITTPSGHGIILYPYCSFFHNMSVALLCWVAVTKLRHPNWRSCDLVFGGLAVGTMILLNTTRLYLMALDIDSYRFWHDGAGSEIFEVVASISVLLLTLGGSRPRLRQI